MDKKVNLFLYDFLMDKSMFEKLGVEFNFFKLVNLHGFVRVFNFKNCELFSNKFGFDCTYLNIDKGELDESVCGVCIKVLLSDLDKLSKEFFDFELVYADLSDFENDNSRFNGYFFRRRHFDAVDYDFNSISQKKYLDLCFSTCLDFSDNFLLSFKKSTYIGDKPLFDL